MEEISIQFTLFSAFYSPLISTMSGGFLEAEGLDPVWSIAPAVVSALAALADGSTHVVRSALSQGYTSLNKGQTPLKACRADQRECPHRLHRRLTTGWAAGRRT
jgi:NitT/TauT family transport system substrate-binding protein